MSESGDLRELIREQSLLANRRTEEFAAEVRRLREEMHRHHDRQDRKLDEVIAEGRAQRAALFRILDRLDPGGAGAG